MKEKSFRFRESFSNALSTMDNSQAGELIKRMCHYIFEGEVLQSNDVTVKSSFSLIKTSLDQEIRDIENGRKGGIVTSEKNKVNGLKDNLNLDDKGNRQQNGLDILEEVIEQYVISEAVKSLLERMECEKCHSENKEKTVAKT